MVSVEQIVLAYCNVKQISWLDPGWIEVVILRAWCRYVNTRRSVLRRSTAGQWCRQSRKNVSAEKPGLNLLIWRQNSKVNWSRRVRREGNCASHKATVVSPIEPDPR